MGMRRVARVALGTLAGNAPERIRHSSFLRIDDIELIRDTYRRHGPAAGTPWDAFRDAHLKLPGWFRFGLDPLGADYAEQQHRLWRLIAGVDRPYDPATDEQEEAWTDVDAVRRPGYYGRRDPQAVTAAADHVMATAMLLKHCGLAPGDLALEYGAGFAQSALALARLGVRVDTVDISARLCDFVRQQADFFQVPMTAFQGQFGMNPRPGERYRAVWFYESFHHCVDFRRVVRQLREVLAEGGRVILAGEPVVEREYAAVPYPWGLRLHSEVLAMVRQMHWFELGFSEAFLFELFVNAGFVARRIDCEPSPFGRMYVFEPRPDEIVLARQWLPATLADGWRGSTAEGLTVGAASSLPLDCSGGFGAVELDLLQAGTQSQRLEIVYGGRRETFHLAPGERRTVRLRAMPDARTLQISCPPGAIGRFGGHSDGEAPPRGVTLQRLRYLGAG